MATAVKAQDRAQHVKKKNKKGNVATLKADLASKKWTDLNNADKDNLLKLIGVQFGFIRDDDD